jgi:hypothetical protein
VLVATVVKKGVQKMRRVVFIGLCFAVALFCLPLSHAADCRFALGFASLHDMVPDVVGQCLENERYNPANGDALQQTTGGLLVWRKVDNFTAFTNGYWTWINGPNGLEDRLNTDRFDWEKDPITQPATPTIPAPILTATPAAVIASTPLPLGGHPWITDKDLRQQQTAERRGVAVNLQRVACGSPDTVRKRDDFGLLRAGNPAASATTIIVIWLKIENRTDKPMLVSPSGPQATLAAGTEQVAGEIMLGDDIGGEFPPGAIREGKVIFLLKRLPCLSIPSGKYTIKAPQVPGGYLKSEDYTLDFMLR